MNRGLALLFTGLATLATKSPASDSVTAPEAHLSGTTIVTTELDRSIEFYTHVLGFQTTRIRDLQGTANLAVYGVTDSSISVRYTALLPADWSKDRTDLSSLNLVEIDAASESALKHDKDRAPVRGEIILAYRVENIEEIIHRAESLGTPLIAPLTPSSTGKSVTATLLDPNGVRVYLYDYLDTE